MFPERWKQIDAIVEQALNVTPESRAAFLAEACAGDESLHREAQALLAARDNAGSFIETSPATAIAEATGSKQADDDQPGKLEGQVLGHYQILSLIGKGGMGEVYLAQDTRLGRKLALKLLPKSFTQDADRVRRFQQEARTASALNHPNIITVYDIGQFEGLYFIATEFIGGETMRALLGRKDVSQKSLLEFLAQVADGLAKAHGANIVHRDLKPDNVMRTRDGFAKVLDFGLAKLVELKPTSNDPTVTAATLLMGRTKPGVVMGTLGYMSPEQAQGKEVDPRADIFSFGCMLYESATGRRPFEGSSWAEVIHKIVYEPAPPVTDFNPQCPAELQRIIRKCLNKDPEKRYQSAKDIAIDLRELNEIGEMGHVAPAACDTAQQNAGEKHTLQILAVTTGDIGRELSDDDSAIQQTVRISRVSVLLMLAGILGFLAIGPAYRRASIDSELKFAFSKDVAINKARENITSLGYNPSGLTSLALIHETDLDLNQVAIQEGVAEARRAVRTGEMYLWTAIFKRAESIINNPAVTGEIFEPKQGEFLVALSTQGRMMSFKTKAQDDAPASEVSKEEVVTSASDAARRLLSLDLSGYAMDFSRKSTPPGMTEVIWRAPQPLFAHQEVVRAELQGK
jgi:serine/threonine protein kinase